MKKVVRLLAILIVLLAASAVPSSAIIPICSEFCSCVDTSCDWGCWDTETRSGTNCGDWGLCSDLCGAGVARGKVNQAAWLVPVQPSASSAMHPDRLPAWATSCTTDAKTARPSSPEAAH